MTNAFHGTPITPASALAVIGRRNFCVSYYRPDQIEALVHLALALLIDNGAFSAWTKGLVLDREYWDRFYDFLRLWLPRFTRARFIMPDVIDAGTQEQDALLRECPADLVPFGWPVWHMDEPISRLLALIDRYGCVAIGSTAEYRIVGSAAWRERMDEAFNAIWATFGAIPPVHMLRGMQCQLPTFDYPFSDVDSTDLARNHNRLNARGGLKPLLLKAKADRWDALNCPTTWPPPRLTQGDLFKQRAA